MGVAGDLSHGSIWSPNPCPINTVLGPHPQLRTPRTLERREGAWKRRFQQTRCELSSLSKVAGGDDRQP